MQPRIAERLRRPLVRARGWLFPAALVTLAPKCMLCVLAYGGLGAALGLGGTEFCGAPDQANVLQVLLLVAPVIILMLTAVWFVRMNHRNGPSRICNDDAKS